MKAGSLVFRTSFEVLDIVEFETGRKSEGGGVVLAEAKVIVELRDGGEGDDEEQRQVQA